MPFDALPEDPTALYRKRRQDAYALWRRVPNDNFQMATWDCGTTACALGWLGRARHDGWSITSCRISPQHVMLVPQWLPISKADPITNAAIYFGITLSEAYHLFDGSQTSARFLGRRYISDVIPRDVGLRLLSMPVKIKHGAARELAHAL